MNAPTNTAGSQPTSDNGTNKRTEMSPDEMLKAAEAWFDRQVTILAKVHGPRWPQHREWLEAYLKEELRQRLIARGWRPKREFP